MYIVFYEDNNILGYDAWLSPLFLLEISFKTDIDERFLQK